MKKFFIRTFGCQMNVNDSEIMAGLLEKAGYKKAEDPKDADVIIINSCAVRKKAEQKFYGAIGGYNRYKKREKKVILAVGGCVVEKERENLLKRFPYVDIFFGTRSFVKITDFVKEAIKGNKIFDLSDYLDLITPDIPKHPESSHHAWITIIYGCNKFCTYCIVPYTRGREKSRPLNEIIEEVKYYNNRGYREITFLGQNVDSYGKDFGDKKTKLHLVLNEASKFENIKRIWFLTSYPSDMTSDLIKTVSENEKVAKNIHLPVQAGSNKILKAMNRGYTREDYLDLIFKIKNNVPKVTVTSDIIVGFPGESEKDFQETLDLVKKARFERLNIAKYSPREGTLAWKRLKDDVSENEKNQRFQTLLELQKKINREENEKYLGKIVRIIQEGKIDENRYYGRTFNNKIVIYVDSSDELTGKFLDVLIKRVSAGPLYGVIDKTEYNSDFKENRDDIYI